jgi:RNA polymerase sigma-70 factor (ECF subfamily)
MIGDDSMPSGDVYAVDDLEASFVAGDDDALRRAYDEHGRLVYTLCRRSLGSDVARDITQEVFAAGWFARRQYDPSRGSLAGWLVGIARHKIIDHLRAQSRRPTTTETPAAGMPAALTVADVEALADRLLLADALAQLPERPKRLIELAFFEQLTHPEIAERCELPIGTVKSDIRRGLAKMRRHLERKP